MVVALALAVVALRRFAYRAVVPVLGAAFWLGANALVRYVIGTSNTGVPGNRVFLPMR